MRAVVAAGGSGGAGGTMRVRRWRRSAARALAVMGRRCHRCRRTCGAAWHPVDPCTMLQHVQRVRVAATDAVPPAAQSFLDRKEVTERVINVVKAFEKVEAAKVTAASHFNKDLGLDSLDAVEVRPATCNARANQPYHYLPYMCRHPCRSAWRWKRSSASPSPMPRPTRS